MRLSPGSHLGPYEIVGPLGAGGMGEVYRARDTKLGREVALKVLPALFTADADRLVRFQREAQVLASLNHPNIGAIHGLEESVPVPAASQGFRDPAPGSEVVRALVLELVEGPTLADRIAHGPLLLDEALPIAREIAEALQAAHERGIVHRDLKPANIKLRPDGVVKVLDFGLAKAAVDDGSADASDSPTITALGTRAGMIIGTAAYMSPEQARGRPIDKRTDIWAFGCVFYEMLTGKRVFERDTISDTLAAVLSSDPDWTTIGTQVPPSIRLVIEQCLEKDRKRRISDISTPLFVMSEPRMAVAASGPVAAVQPPRRSRLWPLVAIGATAVVAVLGAAAWFQTRPTPSRVTRFAIAPVGASAVHVATGGDVAISPDGGQIVYRGIGRLFRRAMTDLEPVPLTTWDFPASPFFSADGQWVGFVAQFQLKKVPITGGSALTLLNFGARNFMGATWGENGTIVFATAEPSTGLERIPDAGGPSTVLTRPDRERGETDHLWPEFLPGGQAVLFTITGQGGIDNAHLAVLDLKTGTYKRLLQGGSRSRYVRSGHIVYGAAGTLRAVAFDLDRLETIGTPVPVLPQLVTTASGGADFDVSADGTLAYVPTGLVSLTRTLVWVDRQGQSEPLKTSPRNYQYLRLSPDGTRVALDIRDQENDIWFWELAGRKLTRLTFDPTQDRFPVWRSNDQVLFMADRTGTPTLFSQASDGTGVAEPLTTSAEVNATPMSVSPDGAWAVLRTGVPQAFDLSLLALSKDHRMQPLLHAPSVSEQNGEISPDGRWLAYQSNEGQAGRVEIYVRPFPNVDRGRWQVSTEGGTQPLWSRGGGELFFLSPTGAVMAVRFAPGPRWTATAPTKLFDGGPYSFGAGEAFGRSYDYDSTSRRFLMIQTLDSPETSAALSVVVVQNWFDELKRLVPTTR